MLGDPQEAEDALQHTFLSAYNDLISSKKQIHLRAWLFTIARNRCYSILRSRREQPAAELDEAVTEGLATQVQRRQDLRDLVVDMRSLPEEQRAALVLAELESLSHEQIGEALGVPREKVKALVFQARESLVASRAARETDCVEIREQLATQRGGALRRANLRRHLRECAGCRDFRKQMERQRRQLAILMPVAPTIALKEGVLAGTAGSKRERRDRRRRPGAFLGGEEWRAEGRLGSRSRRCGNGRDNRRNTWASAVAWWGNGAAHRDPAAGAGGHPERSADRRRRCVLECIAGRGARLRAASRWPWRRVGRALRGRWRRERAPHRRGFVQ